MRFILSRKKVSIIIYHNPGVTIFRKHIELLAKYYNFISLEDYYNALNTNDFSKIPDYALCITFDDGHKGNYELNEVFREFNLKPTIYLCSGIIGSNRHYWDGECPVRRRDHLKRIPNKERILELMKYGFSNERDYPDREALSEDEILHMIQLVDFQSHAKFHPVLINCDHFEIIDELKNSKMRIEELTGKPCIHLAYPHGLYNDEVIQIAESIGYKTARTIDIGWNGRGTNPYKLKVTGISDDAVNETLELQISGISGYLLYLTRGSFLGKFKL